MGRSETPGLDAAYIGLQTANFRQSIPLTAGAKAAVHAGLFQPLPVRWSGETRNVELRTIGTPRELYRCSRDSDGLVRQSGKFHPIKSIVVDREVLFRDIKMSVNAIARAPDGHFVVAGDSTFAHAFAPMATSTSSTCGQVKIPHLTRS